MRRVHLWEIEDQAWCPTPVRDGVTDFLQKSQELGDVYGPVAPLLARALQRSGDSQVVDLCSGGAGPWRKMLRHLEEQGARVDVRLTDLYPNQSAFQQLETESAGRIRGWKHSVDATRVPAELKGFRTLFTGFHHFRPEEALSILADAVRSGESIAIFELTERSTQAFLSVFRGPILTLVLAPLIRPFRWSRLFWTYLVPAIPFVILFDGVVSCLRTYSPDELQELTQQVGEHEYQWEIGQVQGKIPLRLTYLIGHPPARKSTRTARLHGDESQA